MDNGYFLADTNSLVYAYRAGGPELLDAYFDAAKEQDRKFAITKTVEGEIQKGPLGDELLQHLANRNTPVLSAPDTEQRVRAGTLSPISAGEVSMLEIAAMESEAGRVTRIWSDDKYFDSDQIMRGRPDTHRTMSAELLDEAYEQNFIGAADHQKFRAGYEAQQVFIDSQRLNSFRYDFSSPEIDAPHRPRVQGIVGGVLLEGAVTAYEWNETHQRAQVFQNTLHNDTAARDAYVRQGAQAGGALLGTAVGGVTAAAVGTGTGGTALLVAGEGYLFGKAAEHGMELWQKNRVYNIASEGVKWEFKGKQWIREDLRADLVDDGRNLPQQQDFAAPPDKARELSALASAEAVKQSLGAVPTPRDPFVQSAGDGGDPWRYQPDRGVWTREVVTAYDINNNPSASEKVEAKGERAAQLSAEALRIIDQSLAAGPAEIATQYQKGHKAHGYDQTPAGAMPDAVAPALSADVLQASDGKHYHRDTQGVWTHEGGSATGNRALELELTRERLLPALEDHQQQLAHMPPWQPPTPEAQDKAFLREAYLNWSIDRETRPEEFDASYLAVQRTREATGVTAASLVLGQDASGQFTPNSPIHHVRYDANGEIRIAATTTPEDIAKALIDVRARVRGEDTPQQSSPERTITQATPEERDAREQAQREANRQGLSQEDAQQAVHAAAVGASMRGISPAGSATRVSGEQQDAPQAQRERAQDAFIAQGMPAAAKIDPATTPERQNEAETPISADREPQDSRTIAMPAPSTTHDPDALRRGNHGDSVELLQYRLDRQGYRGPDGEQIPQTGQYGPETEHSVRQFQTMHGFPATGVADQDTREAVDRALTAQSERESREPSGQNRSTQESKPVRETPESAIAPRTVSLSASGGRDAEDQHERETQHAVLAEAQMITAPDPALAHRTATRDDREENQPTFSSAGKDRLQIQANEQTQPAPLLMTQPAHPANAMYIQTLGLIERGDIVPAGTLTHEEKSRLAAGTVAQFMARDKNATSVDGLYRSTYDTSPGMPPSLIPVQGDPATDYCRRASINVEQALQTSLEQSSQVSQTVTQAREQEMALAQQEAEQKDMDGPKGPMMRIGPRTLSPSMGPQGDCSGDGGG